MGRDISIESGVIWGERIVVLVLLIEIKIWWRGWWQLWYKKGHIILWVIWCVEWRKIDRVVVPREVKLRERGYGVKWILVLFIILEREVKTHLSCFKLSKYYIVIWLRSFLFDNLSIIVKKHKFLILITILKCRSDLYLIRVF